jgi:ABC-type glycerol-3-phosphate transport system substrate-binding protein
MRSARSLFLAAALGPLVACGGGSSPTASPSATPPPRAVINVHFDPTVITAVPSGNPDYPWSMSVNIVVSETGGVAFQVTSMVTTVTAASTGATVSSAENPFAGVTIPAYGQETRQFSWPEYKMDDSDTKEGVLAIRLTFVDQYGVTYVFEGSINIQRRSEPVPLGQG